jgi:hypothetical protein
MTEAQWFAVQDVGTLLEHLRANHSIARTKAGRRRLRLFNCACLRRIWEHLEEEGKRVVERMERVCDGQEPATALTEIWAQVGDYARWVPHLDERATQARSALAAAAAVAGYPVQYASYVSNMVASARAPQLNITHARQRIDPEEWRAIREAVTEEVAAHVAILRDLFGTPYRPLAKRKFPGDVRGLAQSCADGDWGALPILIDALADLGEEAAAEHLRQPLHVRGCHVVDWVLGRP